MIDLAIDALAVYRLTKLVVDDELTIELRDAAVCFAYASDTGAPSRRPESNHPGAWAEMVTDDPDPPKLATLVTCPWCAGVWVAFAVVAARRIVPRLWAPMAKALAMSATTGLLSIADG